MFSKLWVANKHRSAFIEEAITSAEVEKTFANGDQQRRRRHITIVLGSIKKILSTIVEAMKDRRWYKVPTTNRSWQKSPFEE